MVGFKRFSCLSLVTALLTSVSLLMPQQMVIANGQEQSALNATVENESVQEENSDTIALSEDELVEVEAILDSRGVAPELRAEIIEKVKTGGLADADNPEVKPISVEEVDSNGQVVRKMTFPDGSIGIASSQISEPEVVEERAGISQCRSYDYSRQYRRHDGCRIAYNGISFSYSFIADYSTAKVAGFPATIRGVRSPEVHQAIGHTVSGTNVSIIHSWQRGSSAAHARMSVQMTPFKVLWTTSMFVNLYVKDGTAWDQY